ncbi:MAG: hypothetical protein M1514_04160 [Patescibacteria group bacterium]|nr:hypothetical protein [Patescibacteria group bacterium]
MRRWRWTNSERRKKFGESYYSSLSLVFLALYRNSDEMTLQEISEATDLDRKKVYQGLLPLLQKELVSSCDHRNIDYYFIPNTLYSSLDEWCKS